MPGTVIANKTAAGFRSLCTRVRQCFVCDGMNHCHVLGETNGPLDADVLFVAEAPGRLGAARTGVPMTSDVTGRRFHTFLAEAGLARERIFVTNSILCNPLSAGGNNRRPAAREVVACSSFLAATLDIVRAPIVVALGGVALDALGRIEGHVAELRRDVGQAREWRGRTLMALYHPSIQSTLSRPHATQVGDWRRLGRLVAKSVA